MIFHQKNRIATTVAGMIAVAVLLVGGYLLFQWLAPDDSPTGPVIEPSGDTQTHQGLTIAMSNYRIVDNQIMAEICFDKPSPEDWQIYEADIIEFNNGLRPPKWSLECYKGMCPPANEMGMKCDTLSFPIPAAEQIHSFTIRIEDIVAVPTEGKWCEPELIASFQRAIDEIQPGILLDCWRTPGIGGIKIVGVPEGMSSEEASDIYNNANLLARVRGRKGPWVFRARVLHNGQ